MREIWGREGALPNACITSGIESKAGCAGVGFDNPFVVPLTAGEPWSSATMVDGFGAGTQCLVFLLLWFLS